MDRLERHLKNRKAARHFVFSREYVNTFVAQKKSATPLRLADAFSAKEKPFETPLPRESPAGGKNTGTGSADFKPDKNGDFYLWTGAFLFILFFAVCFGKDSFEQSWFDLSRVSRVATVDDGAVPAAENSAGGDTAIVAFSKALAELRVVPAMSDDSFYPLEKGVYYIGRAIFVSQFHDYSMWLGDELLEKMTAAGHKLIGE